MTLSKAVVFIIIYLLLDLVFSRPLDWWQMIFEGIAFGVIMTAIQAYKEKKQKQ